METKIKSVSEFIEAIIKNGQTRNHDAPQDLWFRGEGSVNLKTPLVPSSYRTTAESFNNKIDDFYSPPKIKHLENNLQAEFIRRAQRYFSTKSIENSQWNSYFLMQHYKINTRLLDWTENAMLSLFFAISDKTFYEDDSIVWILKPFVLNDFTIKAITKSKKSCMIIPPGVDSDGQHELIMGDGSIRISELTRRYVQMDFVNEIEDDQIMYYPLAIYPTYLDERMAAQRTCFTIFGNKINGLLSNNLYSKFLSSVIIEGGATKTKILKELRLLGIDFESIFPDLDGIGLSIKSMFEQDFADNRESMIHVMKSLHDKNKHKKH